eukprot:1387307-Amphidinium_carterae.2
MLKKLNLTVRSAFPLRSQGFRTAHSMTKAYGIFNVNLNSGTVEERRSSINTTVPKHITSHGLALLKILWNCG